MSGINRLIGGEEYSIPYLPPAGLSVEEDGEFHLWNPSIACLQDSAGKMIIRNIRNSRPY